jgi:hypothetical protein
MTTGTPLRLFAEPLPKLMENLPVDERGYVVPWFVDWINGKPEFRAMDGNKYRLAVRNKLCWVCGGALKGTYVFVAGPMCGINTISSEPPCHPDCARWSARNCPFLSKPKMVRREDGLHHEDGRPMSHAELVENAAGVMLTRNPGVTMLWFTREYQMLDDSRGRPLVIMGRPAGVEWYREGRVATREEVLESIDEGFPALEVVDRTPAGLESIRRKRQKFEAKWLPKK